MSRPNLTNLTVQRLRARMRSNEGQLTPNMPRMAAEDAALDLVLYFDPAEYGAGPNGLTKAAEAYDQTIDDAAEEALKIVKSERI